MKKIFIFAVLILLAISVCGCSLQCEHEWKEADCNSPRYCSKCLEVEEEILGHSWAEATCLVPKTCTRCAATEGELAEHCWEEATCSAPKTCTVCKKTEGDLLEHSWVEANCTDPKTCSVCAITEGEAKGHDWQAATLTTPKTCKVCAVTEGEPQKSTGDEIDEEFYKKATGYWFAEGKGFFVGIKKGKETSGWIPGEFSAPGKIKKIEKTDENAYEVTIFYAAYDSGGVTSPEQTVIYTYVFSGQKKTVKINGVKMTYYGSNQEKALAKYSEKYLY